MSFQANVLKVMIASPGDVAEERRIVTEEIHRWNDANASTRRLVLLPVKWETHSTPQLGSPPQTIINRQLVDGADILIGIFGARIGTPTEEYVSGTVEEIRRHVAAGGLAKVYFSEVPVSPRSLDPGQYASSREFRDECQSTGLYGTFSSTEQFQREFGHHLDLELNQPRYLWLKVDEPITKSSVQKLSSDAIRLLRAAARDSNGMVTCSTAIGRADVISGGYQEFTDGSSRSAARWRRAITELVASGLLEEAVRGQNKVSDSGYEMADQADVAEEASRPTELTVTAVGAHQAQLLHIRSSRVVTLTHLEFLTPDDVCVSKLSLSEVGNDIEVRLPQGQDVALTTEPDGGFQQSSEAKSTLQY
jgi:hypothetical protein